MQLAKINFNLNKATNLTVLDLEKVMTQFGNKRSFTKWTGMDFQKIIDDFLRDRTMQFEYKGEKSQMRHSQAGL